jgi:hypothetical protein
MSAMEIDDIDETEFDMELLVRMVKSLSLENKKRKRENEELTVTVNNQESAYKSLINKLHVIEKAQKELFVMYSQVEEMRADIVSLQRELY